MANTFFKPFAEADRTSSRTLLHEVIPITGTIVSGTYANHNNVKSFSHGMFKSVYDYPFLSSSANHIFDVTFGYHASSSYSGSASTQNKKKLNIYSQMAQVLSGFDTNSKIKRFDKDGNFSTTGDKMNHTWFLTFSRLLVKDEIKKGSFSMTLGTAPVYGDNAHTASVTLTDSGAETNYKINSPAGEYGLLYTSSVLSAGANPSYGTPQGLVYYQAGVAVLTGSVHGVNEGQAGVVLSGSNNTSNNLTFASMASGSTIDAMADAFLHRLCNVQFNNTTELNSTIYFCRANHNEFNYSSNPTYLSGSKLIVKGDNRLAPPKSYATTVGLYSADNELLAVAKLSEPLRKDPTNELTLRVRLDY